MAHPDNPTWLDTIEARHKEEEGYELYTSFLQSIDRLDIRPEYLRGNIAVIGQANLFPERSLLCEDDNWVILKPDVSLLVCFDDIVMSSPGHWLDTPVTIAPTGDEVKNLPHGSVVWYPLEANYAIGYYQLPSNCFNTILMFQIVDLEDQLSNDLLQSVTRILKPGGYFIGSGGSEETHGNLYETLAKNEDKQIRMIQKVRLPISYSGYPFNENTGVILQKT